MVLKPLLPVTKTGLSLFLASGVILPRLGSDFVIMVGDTYTYI